MGTSAQNTQTLMEKIQSLPAERIAQVDDFVDFLRQRVQSERPVRHKSFDFPVISVGKWPENLSLHREDMYGDDGR